MKAEGRRMREDFRVLCGRTGVDGRRLYAIDVLPVLCRRMSIVLIVIKPRQALRQ